MKRNIKDGPGTSAGQRLIVSALIGGVVAIIVGQAGDWSSAPLLGWDAAALLYMAWLWLDILPMNAQATKAHALREEPGRNLSHVILLAASSASLVAVGLLIANGGASNMQKVWNALFALVSVVIGWALIHTTYTLRYASLYYGDPEGGIDFNQSEAPRYSDFAYVAFTMGMTFQVSDTALQSSIIRSNILRQALLSYVFGTVIIATTINAVVNLAQ